MQRPVIMTNKDIPKAVRVGYICYRSALTLYYLAHTPTLLSKTVGLGAAVLLHVGEFSRFRNDVIGL